MTHAVFISHNTSDCSFISAYFPPRLRRAVSAVCASNAPEEIRVRADKPVQLIYSGHESFLRLSDRSYAVCSYVDCAAMLDSFCMHSCYSREEEMKQGFITLEGGVRVGLSGRVRAISGCASGFTDINAFNIRLPREYIGCANEIMPFLDDGILHSALIISPPAAGKTTLLRDIARQLSKKHKVCIVDERSELAGCINALPSFDVGQRTDVLDACPKAVGMLMAVRTLSPDVIIADEIGSNEDAEAIMTAASCGVAVIAATHASTLSDLRRRKSINSLLSSGAFEHFIGIGGSFCELAHKPMYIGSCEEVMCL